jgi:hypothetical protein
MTSPAIQTIPHVQNNRKYYEAISIFQNLYNLCLISQYQAIKTTMASIKIKGSTCGKIIKNDSPFSELSDCQNFDLMIELSLFWLMAD